MFGIWSLFPCVSDLENQVKNIIMQHTTESSYLNIYFHQRQHRLCTIPVFGRKEYKGGKEKERERVREEETFQLLLLPIFISVLKCICMQRFTFFANNSILCSITMLKPNNFTTLIFMQFIQQVAILLQKLQENNHCYDIKDSFGKKKPKKLV